MEINLLNVGKVKVIELIGRIDALNNAKTEDFFIKITDNPDSDIIVDCEKLDYINSSGLRVFIVCLKKQKGVHFEMLLCNMQKNIKEVFQYSGFDKLYDINLNKEDALKKLS